MTICPLGDAFCEPIKSFLKHFGHEFEAAIAAAQPLPAAKTPVLRCARGTAGTAARSVIVLKLTIDGTEVQVAPGTNLVEAAATIGINIPTYCYHPGLSVVGQCRICFVEVEGMPRLVTACSTEARDGMVVLTASPRVKDARAAVMEFLLENHPLDCPVCDQAGECFLQDYSVEHGLDTTHMVDIRRTFPGLERRLIGPHVVQNQNRCIHCTAASASPRRSPRPTT